jgi:hypothetical protein
MKTNSDQSKLSSIAAKTIGEVYASLVQRNIERKVAAKVPDNKIVIPAKVKGTEAKANDKTFLD